MKNPFKIVNCVFGDASGGRWQAMINMSDALESCGHEVLIVTGSENKKLKAGDKPVVFLSNSGFYDLFSAFKASCWLRKVKPDVIIAHSGRAVCLFKNAMFFNNLNIPVIAVNHSHNVKRTIRADGFIHITPYVAQCVLEVANKKKIDISQRPEEVISNLIYLPDESPNFDRTIGSPIVCGIMTRLVAYKGTHLAISAIHQLKQQGENVQLLIAGEGEQKNELIKQVKDLDLEGEVQFLGWIGGNEKKKFYQKIDIALVPTMNDTQPLAILDAFAWGKAVIASDHISVQQIIRHGENGLMTTCGDAQNLAENIRHVVKNNELILELSKMGYEDACFKYSFEHISNLLDGFVRQLGN